MDQIEHELIPLVGVFTDPIIVWPSSWNETLPETLKTEVTMQRLIQLMTKETGLATYAEVTTYMYALTLEHPLDHDWVEIYIYCAGRSLGGRKLPKELEIESLCQYHEGLLTDLRRWLWNSRMKARKEKARAGKQKVQAAKRQAPPVVAASAPDQLRMLM